MRIAILQGAFFPVPPLRGGAIEKLWHSLGLEFAHAGHQVTHVSRLCDGLPARSEEGGVTHLRVRGYDQPANRYVLKACDLEYSWRACARIPPCDIIVTNSFWSPLLLRRRPEKICVVVERMPKGQMRLYRGAARLRASTGAVRDAIVRDDPKAAARIAVIPNPLPRVPGRAVDWSQKARTILFVGRLHREKGIEMLLEAFSRGVRSGLLAAWKLQLVGPAAQERGGSGQDWADALRAKYGQPGIEWLGSIYDPAELDGVFERASLFVYPTTAEEGEAMPVAPLEAMAWGAVPVVSRLACFEDYIQSGRNGFSFDHRTPDPAATLEAALAAAVRADLRGMGGEATAVRVTHAPDRIAGLFLEDFKSLLG